MFTRGDEVQRAAAGGQGTDEAGPTGINPLKYAGGESRDREHLHLLPFSCCCLWGPEAEMKTGNRGDERMKRLWSRVPRWRQVGMAENRQEMARAARGGGGASLPWPRKQDRLSLFLASSLPLTLSSSPSLSLRLSIERTQGK